MYWFKSVYFRASKKKKKGAPEEKNPKDGKKSQAAKISESKSQDRVGQLKSQESKKKDGDSDHPPVGKSGSGTERPDSHATERIESAVADGEAKWV